MNKENLNEEKPANLRISPILHERLKKAQKGTGLFLNAFVERALVTYLEDHAKDIRQEKERFLKIRGRE